MEPEPSGQDRNHSRSLSDWLNAFDFEQGARPLRRLAESNRGLDVSWRPVRAVNFFKSALQGLLYLKV